MNIVIENNKVKIAGEICGNFEYSHEVYGEKFYVGHIRTERMSKVADLVPVMVSERLLDISEDLEGKFVELEGQFRSYNRHEGNISRLMLYVFVKEIKFSENTSLDLNSIELDGYVCKKPVYRQTPHEREVTDILFAVNRQYKKSDYIPCIAWGRNARFTGNLKIGTHLKLKGRIQSREYIKRISDTETETRTAYEVSVSKLEVVEN